VRIRGSVPHPCRADPHRRSRLARAGTIVLPGVTIGDEVTIGAGSLVTSDIPAGMLAFGQPCRVQRHL
jgi:acetyltransferase-like isoleucine patch superfamily enzyme